MPESLQQRNPDQLHANYMGLEMTSSLAYESIHWIRINNDIKKTIKNCPVCFDFQATQPNEKTVSHKTPGKQWDTVCESRCFLINQQLLFM